MFNYLNKAFGCSLLTAGFILGGCSSLNNYENEPSAMQKPTEIKTEWQILEKPVTIFYNPTIKSIAGIDRSNFYLVEDASLDEKIYSGYKESFSPQTNYLLFNDGGREVTREQAREQLLKYLGLEDTILSGKFDIYGEKVNLSIKPNLNPFSDSQDVWAILSLRF